MCKTVSKSLQRRQKRASPWVAVLLTSVHMEWWKVLFLIGNECLRKLILYFRQIQNVETKANQSLFYCYYFWNPSSWKPYEFLILSFWVHSSLSSTPHKDIEKPRKGCFLVLLYIFYKKMVKISFIYRKLDKYEQVKIL